MRKIRNLVVGTALAGSLAAGLAAPGTAAQAATGDASTTAGVTATAQAQRLGGSFGPIYSGFGRGEDRGHRSYVKGFWGVKGGRDYVDFDLFDRDRDRQYSWADFYYHDDEGWHFYKRYKTFGHYHTRLFFNDSDIDGFRFRVGEGSTSDYDWSGWKNYGF
ncbi:hypothetical protein DQ384_32730 [Sphaerisporangium album]|uniref:Uncharacterized protein n=1 Tax=Sphaerisporangium album TaxID=509200 RepID=A0A367F2C6_9ACTN|nr:hypothetical protein [Sphaerisporangium album]RCG24421.1 hypothetical protein DQ384_32730 [Sphaerisporangium album]